MTQALVWAAAGTGFTFLMTALGAAMLAMLSADLTDEKELSRLRRSERVFAPDPSVRDAREAGYREYRNAVRRALLR